MTARHRFWMYIGLALVLVLGAGELWPTPVLADALLIGAAICFVGAAFTFPKVSRSKYDLNSLLEIHERAELEAIDIGDVRDFDSVHCLACGEVYSIQLPVCPRCSSSQGAPPSG